MAGIGHVGDNPGDAPIDLLLNLAAYVACGEGRPADKRFLRTIGGECSQAGERSLTTSEAVHSNRVINRSKTRLQGRMVLLRALMSFLDKNGFEELPRRAKREGPRKKQEKNMKKRTGPMNLPVVHLHSLEASVTTMLVSPALACLQLSHQIWGYS